MPQVLHSYKISVGRELQAILQLEPFHVLLDSQQAQRVEGLLLDGENDAATGLVYLADALVDSPGIVPDGLGHLRLDIRRPGVGGAFSKLRRLRPCRLTAVGDLPCRLPPRQPVDVVQTPDRPVTLGCLTELAYVRSCLQRIFLVLLSVSHE